MPSRTAFASLAVAVLALAGCGGTLGTPTTAGRISSGPQPIKYARVRSATYTANLSGTNGTSGENAAQPGAPNGSGFAVISVNAPKRKLCWKFSRLKNVTAPTQARMYFREAGLDSWKLGQRLGRVYKSSGCIPTPAGTKSLEYGPQQWWVAIHSAHFPGGAVRGQL